MSSGWLDGYDGGYQTDAPRPVPGPVAAGARATVTVIACPICSSIMSCTCIQRRTDTHRSRWECGECGAKWLESSDIGRIRMYLAG